MRFSMSRVDSGRRLPLALVLAVAILGGCEAPREVVLEAYLPTDARDAYRRSLQQAGLAGTALGLEWQQAADTALATPVQIVLPYRERGLFDARQATAFGYRFAVTRGQRAEVTLTLDAPSPAVFLEIFRVADAGEPITHVASGDPAARRLVFEPRQDGDYVLRVQPELLRGGGFDLQVRVDASLHFPVQGHGASAILSVFGAERDGGRRSHQGVDIFAPRGTPAVATSRALVRRVREQDLGGKVVWLHDQARGLHLYYAHLDEQLVEAGTWVNAGDIVGLVGNTGNARTTPPHLHFGVYAAGEGPLDPDAFLRPTRQADTAIAADTALIGAFAEAGIGDARLRGRPDDAAQEVAALSEGTPLRIWAAVGGFYRVAVGDGVVGFVPADDVRMRRSGAPTND